ncbi:hypothetical protein CHARACLAT_015064 [Characodon lateralis]|uniref:Uncharacterized protein n=1 Tax=Characodon lateralis TaxID=208331 RepID=A0ABU7DH74_9TELE|nr:hypothetical protein [Characodon lateralis]
MCIGLSRTGRSTASKAVSLQAEEIERAVVAGVRAALHGTLPHALPSAIPMLLDEVMWPVRDTDDDEEDCEAESMCHVTGFLRTFIETASSDTLVQLLRFWAGWEVLPSEIQVEISGGIFVLHQCAWRH